MLFAVCAHKLIIKHRDKNLYIFKILATLSDDVIGIRNIADYLLYWMNKHENYSYVEFFGLNQPCDNITEVLVKGSVHLNNIEEYRNIETSKN